MKETQPLALSEPQPLAPTELSASPSTGALIAAVIHSGVTSDKIDIVERLVALKEREETRQAEKDFAASFVALQSQIPKIEPTRGIPGKDNKVKYMYAPYEEIMRKVRPLLTQHGFSVSFDSDFKDGVVTVTCKLQHVHGHRTETRHSARIGRGPVNASEAQADGAAQTYAKRFALCSALNIVIEHDTDGGNDDDARNAGGETVTPGQAADLQALCEETNADKTKFLAWAHSVGAKELGPDHTFETIPAHRFEELFAKLNDRRK